jgi:hypothetical protein
MSSRGAIERSIEKWERIQKAIEEGNKEEAKKLLERSCPLCNELREDNGKVDCEACSIMKLTGRESCLNTPYYGIYSEVVLRDRSLHIGVREQDRNKLIPLLSLVTEMLGILRSC